MDLLARLTIDLPYTRANERQATTNSFAMYIYDVYVAVRIVEVIHMNEISLNEIHHIYGDGVRTLSLSIRPEANTMLV